MGYFCNKCDEFFNEDESEAVVKKYGIKKTKKIFCPNCETSGRHIKADDYIWTTREPKEKWGYEDSIALWYPNGKGD